MSRIYKVFVKNHYDGSTVRTTAVKPSLDTFESFKEEIFCRFPDPNRQKFELYYEDADFDKISIVHSKDFELFQQRKIDKIFAIVSPNALFFVHNDDATALLPSQGSASSSTVNVGSAGSVLIKVTSNGEKTNLDAEREDVVDSWIAKRQNQQKDPLTKQRKVIDTIESVVQVGRPTRIFKQVP